jgi:hypothetical protein
MAHSINRKETFAIFLCHEKAGFDDHFSQKQSFV